MNMNKEDNDRMFAKLTKTDAELDLARHYEAIARSKRVEEGAFLAMMIAIALLVGVACVAIGVDTYLKLKNNGQRSTNSIEFNLRK